MLPVSHCEETALMPMLCGYQRGPAVSSRSTSACWEESERPLQHVCGPHQGQAVYLLFSFQLLRRFGGDILGSHTLAKGADCFGQGPF